MTSRTGHCPQDKGTEQQVPQAATEGEQDRSASTQEGGAECSRGLEWRRHPAWRSVLGPSLSEPPPCGAASPRAVSPTTRAGFYETKHNNDLGCTFQERRANRDTSGSRAGGGGRRSWACRAGSRRLEWGQDPGLWRVSLLTRHCCRLSSEEHPGVQGPVGDTGDATPPDELAATQSRRQRARQGLAGRVDEQGPQRICRTRPNSAALRVPPLVRFPGTLSREPMSSCFHGRAGDAGAWKGVTRCCPVHRGLWLQGRRRGGGCK